jgi:hypothetical protein
VWLLCLSFRLALCPERWFSFNWGWVYPSPSHPPVYSFAKMSYNYYKNPSNAEKNGGKNHPNHPHKGLSIISNMCTNSQTSSCKHTKELLTDL